MTPTTPIPASSIFSAINWIDQLLLGVAGMIIATLAVAILGLLTLQGRLPVRQAVSVLLGCFVLFGAPIIASGLIGTAKVQAGGPATPLPTPAPVYTAAVPKAVPYDPYAGASVPTRETQPGIDLVRP